MPSYPKNYPFYSWMPKPLGIIILLFFFLPILTVGGVYSVNSTEMMSGLGIISEHIQFANFVTSIGMAAFAPFLYQLVCGTLLLIKKGVFVLNQYPDINKNSALKR